MAGIGSRFAEYGFKMNKYLLPINVSMERMIEKAILSLNINVSCNYTFIIREEQGFDNELRNILDDIATKNNLSYQIVSVSKLTEGPASTVYEAHDYLDKSQPLLVSNSDQVLEWDFTKFYKHGVKYDGCVLTYKPEYELTIGSKDKHSFIKLNDNNLITQCAEKIVLSENALVGVHYFKSANIFFEAYDYMIHKNMRAPNGEFYLSLAYQAMIEQNKTVGYIDIKNTDGAFYPVGEPDDYFSYLYRKGGYNKDIQTLQNNTVIFENDKVKVTYQIYREKEFIQNRGLILVLEGLLTVGEISLTTDKITSEDVYTNIETRIIHIELLQKNIHKISDTNKVWKLTDFTRGWFIGNFLPNIIKTSDFEIAKLHHGKDEKWPFHYHKEADEYNVLLKGKMILNGNIIHEKSLFIIHKNEIACPFFLEDCQVLCIKSPSSPKDKYII